MRVIFLLLVSSIAFKSQSQTWNNYLQKRFKSYGIWADSILLVPNDTTVNKNGFAIKGTTAYIGNGSKWTAISGGSSVVDSLVYATWRRLYKVVDSVNLKYSENIGNTNLRLTGNRTLSGGAGASNGYSFTFDSTASINGTRKSDGLDYFYVGQDGEFIIKNILNESFKVDSYGGVLMQSANNAEDDMPTRVTLSAQQDTATFTFSSTTKIKAEKVNPNNGSSYKLVALNDATKEFETVASVNVDTTNRTTGIRSNARAIGDSTVLSAAINAKPNFGDIRDEINDSLNPIRAKILADSIQAASVSAGKVNIADTASMLSGYRNASILNAGTVADARLSSNVALKNIDNSFTANQTISKTNPQLDIVSATTNKASLLRGETTNTFTLTNDVLEIGGAASNCISFNNANQYIGASPTGITGVTQWTVSFWINRVSQTATNVVYFGDGTNNYQITFCCGSTGFLGVYYNGSISNWFTTSPVATSGWQHFVVTKDASNILRIYINGSLNVTPVAAITNISNISSFRIGNVSGLPNVFASAQNAPTSQRIDQVLMYNTALSLANVQTIYASGTGTTTLPSTGNLLLRYELNEGTTTTTTNQGTASSGNGTLVNGVVWEIANGRIPTEAAIQLGTAINIRDGILNGERGQYRFGDPFGGTILRGRSIKFQAPLETNFSFIHNGTSTLLDPNNTNTSAVGASPLTVVGNTYLGANVAATARLHIAAGTTTASTAPIKLTAGTNMTTPEAGAVEFDGTNYFVTSSTTRFTLAKTLTTTAELDFPNTNGGDQSDLTVSLTNAAVGDVVMLGVPVNSASDGIFFAFVSSANTITVRFLNHKGTAIDPTFGTFRVSIIKY